MKNKKIILALLLIFTLLVFAGCGTNNTRNLNTPDVTDTNDRTDNGTNNGRDNGLYNNGNGVNNGINNGAGPGRVDTNNGNGLNNGVNGTNYTTNNGIRNNNQ